MVGCGVAELLVDLGIGERKPQGIGSRTGGETWLLAPVFGGTLVLKGVLWNEEQSERGY